MKKEKESTVENYIIINLEYHIFHLILSR